jgi:uncharacterized protein (TIGR00156 family)
MKWKYFASLIILSAFVGLTVNAQDGYKGPGSAFVTVKEAKELKDDTPVVLRGKVEKFFGDEKYLFSDSSGNITIEIDDKLWKGISIDQNDLVEIMGEVDKDFVKVEVDVKSIKKI